MEPNYWKVKRIAYLGSHCSRTAYKYSALLLKHYQVISTLLKFMQNNFQCFWENDVRVSGYLNFGWSLLPCTMQTEKIRVALLESSNIII